LHFRLFHSLSTRLQGRDYDYDEDDASVLGLDELQRLGLDSQQPLDPGAGDAASADPTSRQMLESNVDSTDWRLEVERILPQLRATVHTNSKVRLPRIVLGRFGTGKGGQLPTLNI